MLQLSDRFVYDMMKDADPEYASGQPWLRRNLAGSRRTYHLGSGIVLEILKRLSDIHQISCNYQEWPMPTASDMEESQFRTVYTHRGCSPQGRPFRYAAADSPAQNVKLIGPELVVVDFPNGFFDFTHNRCRQLV